MRKLRKRMMGWAGVVAALVVVSPVLFAQTAAPPGGARGIPDLSGVWDNTAADVNRGGPTGGPPGGLIGPGNIPSFGFTLEEPEMRPAAAEKYKAARTGVVRGRWDRGIGALDPANRCFPHGPTRLFTLPRPWEIRQMPDVVFLLFEADHWVRRIYVDGRGHPEGYPISWMGHSIGTYDGDSLVVDTIGMHDETWIDTLGHPHSEALRVVERFRRVDPTTLQIDLIFDDPETYTKPWTGKKIFQLAPPSFEVLEEVICEEWLEMGKRREPAEVIR